MRAVFLISLTLLLVIPQGMAGNSLFARDFALYHVSPMKYEVLDGSRLPANPRLLKKLSIRVSCDEYEPLSFLIDSARTYKNVIIKWSDFIGPGVIPATELDAHIVKVWWVAHEKARMGSSKYKNNPSRIWKPLLIQELLVHDDKLIRVNRDKVLNEVRVRDRNSGRIWYVDVCSKNSRLPSNIEIFDSKRIRPFDITSGVKKQIWLTIHVPQACKPGKYRSQIVLKVNNLKLAAIPIEIEVLPFKLDLPVLHFGVYYKSHFVNTTNLSPGRFEKSMKQYFLELKDMKNHGFLYPSCHINIQSRPHLLDKILTIYEKVGLPTDRFIYSRQKFVYKENPIDIAEKLKKWNVILKKHNPNGIIYCYGRDEATGSRITRQLANWDVIRNNGGKVWASIAVGQFQYTAGKLDVAVLHGGTQGAASLSSGFDENHKREIKKYHDSGARVWSYAHPFAGQENAEIYRRNYGLALWKAGYDGVMNFIYQFTAPEVLFNDFMHGNYRDLSYTIPITDGLISTVGWEGMREAVDDVRYLSTLLNKMDALKKSGGNIHSLQLWITGLDPFNGDLDKIRQKIIDKILSVEEKK